MADYPPGALTAAAEALAVHRWKSMGVASAECECGAILHGDADPFPADEAFRAHLAGEILQAATPHLLAAEVSAHRAEQDAVHADLSQLLRVLGMGDHARPQSSHEVMLDAINEVGRIRTQLAELENAVSWNTSCTSCAAVLDSSIREHSRAEAAEERTAGMAEALERAKAIIEERDGQLEAARTEERQRIREVLTSDHAVTVAGWAVEAELMAGVPYDEHVLSDEAVARAALGAAVKLLEENR